MRFLLFITFISTVLHANEPRSMVSYELGSGRFGDQLIAFSHALWFSHVLRLPLKYTPFWYSDQLSLYTDPEIVKGEVSSLRKLRLDSQKDYLHFYYLLSSNQFSEGFLFEVPYYPDGNSYLYEGRGSQFTHINWKDPQFLKRLQTLISPHKALPKQELPKDCLSVALHYRSGEGFDPADWKKMFPLKGPPDHFYEEALSLLYEAVQQPLYVFIFTDSPHPAALRHRFERRFAELPITFACREEGNSHDRNVIEDFFAFRDFDCLIRPDSNFSLMASRLFPFKIVVSPAHFRKDHEGQFVIDQIQFDFAPTEHVGHPFCTILHHGVWNGVY